MSRTASASRAIGLLVVLVAVSIPLSIATNVSASGREPGASLTLTPDSGSCDTAVMATGGGFITGTTVTIFAGPTPGDEFGVVARALVAADGRFSAPVSTEMFLPGCRGGAMPTTSGQRYVVGAMTGKGPKEGDDWREPVALPTMRSDVSLSLISTAPLRAGRSRSRSSGRQTP